MNALYQVVAQGRGKPLVVAEAPTRMDADEAKYDYIHCMVEQGWTAEKRGSHWSLTRRRGFFGRERIRLDILMSPILAN